MAIESGSRERKAVLFAAARTVDRSAGAGRTSLPRATEMIDDREASHASVSESLRHLLFVGRDFFGRPQLELVALRLAVTVPLRNAWDASALWSLMHDSYGVVFDSGFAAVVHQPVVVLAPFSPHSVTRSGRSAR